MLAPLAYYSAIFVRPLASTLVGQPSGGNQRGLNGGELACTVLPHSGVAVGAISKGKQ
ncbi:MAG: hypothetical protein U0599_27095 [Vicinamibacteria bacterium]